MNEYRDKAQDKDWERISELLREADCVPDAPDCRASVMARIARPKPVLRYRWAYATGFAALVIAAIGIAPFLTNSGQRDRVAYSPRTKHSAPALTAKPETKLYALAPRANQPQQTPRSIKHLAHKEPVMMAMAPPSTPTPIARELGVSSDNYARSDRSVAKVTLSDGFDSPAKEISRPLSLGDYKIDSLKSAAATPARRTAVGDPVSTGANANALALDSDAKDTDTVSLSAGYEMAVGNAASAPTARATTGGNFFAYREYGAAPSRPASVGRAYSAVTASGGTAIVGTPIAVAMVTWPSNGQPRDSYNYAYTNRDTATGNTTECRVKRSGNSVEIYMESKPAITDPPVRGSLDHEAVPNV